MNQMRGLLLIALGIFVLFLVITGRLKRFPMAWGYLVDGAFGDALAAGAGAPVTPAASAAPDATRVAPTTIAPGSLTLPKLPGIPGLPTVPSVGAGGTSGVVPWPKGGPNGGIDPNTGKPWKF